MTDKLIGIGFTKKTHGAQGELKVSIKDEYLEDFVNAEAVFIQVQGKPLPFFIENLRDAGDILLKLEEVDSPAAAKELTSKELYMRETDLKVAVAVSPIHVFEQMVGYELADETTGPIGNIISVETLPQQYLAIVSYQEREVFIPLHANLVAAVDHQGKKITLRLPDGLLEL